MGDDEIGLLVTELSDRVGRIDAARDYRGKTTHALAALACGLGAVALSIDRFATVITPRENQ